jgi:hypothetical protein
VPFPTPRPGLVIGYSYLWLAEHRRGQVEGKKDRPCVIVLATEDTADGTVVTVAPITHSPPQDEAAVEIPATTKQRLGLDAERSWVVVSEVNRFVWAGPDLRPISRENAGRFDYGMLPPALFTRIRNLLIEHARQRRTNLVVRQE